MAASSTRSNPERIARFRIEKRLGAGHAGTVYAAEDESDRRRVALRVIPPGLLDAEGSARLIADARASIGVEHPNLASVLDAGDAPEGAFIAAELASGRSLRSRIEGHGRLDLAESLRIAGEIASGVASLHRAGRVHGGLDDDRVILDDTGRTRVTGLGLAELARDSIARPPDARSDVYAIGALLHEMVGGVRGPTREGSSERLSSLDEPAPASVNALIARATDRDPSRRFADADDVLAALTRIDLPSDPLAAQAAETREAVSAGASKLWVVGASVVLAAVLALALAIVVSMAS